MPASETSATVSPRLEPLEQLRDARLLARARAGDPPGGQIRSARRAWPSRACPRRRSRRRRRGPAGRAARGRRGCRWAFRRRGGARCFSMCVTGNGKIARRPSVSGIMLGACAWAPTLALVLSVRPSASSAAAEVVDRIAATVNDTAIPESEVRTRHGRLRPRAASPARTPEAFRARVLDALIEEHLEYEDAARFGPAPPDAAGDRQGHGEPARAASRPRARIPTPSSRRAGMTADEVRASIERQLVIARYLRERFAPIAYADEEQAREEYEKRYVPEQKAAGAAGRRPSTRSPRRCAGAPRSGRSTRRSPSGSRICARRRGSRSTGSRSPSPRTARPSCSPAAPPAGQDAGAVKPLLEVRRSLRGAPGRVAAPTAPPADAGAVRRSATSPSRCATA